MKRVRRPRNRTMAVLLAALVVFGGMPFVIASHGNDLLSPWREIPDQPTGNRTLDAAIAAASEALDEASRDPRFPSLDEPQVPATFFHDWFDPAGDRIGGWGDWQEQPGSGNWHLATAAGARQVPQAGVSPRAQEEREHVEQGLRFGRTDGYPTPPSLGAFQMVSPLIGLQSLPVDVNEGTQDLTTVLGSSPLPNLPAGDPNGPIAQAHQTAAQGETAPHRILLYLDHRFSLACQDVGATGTCDGIGSGGFSNFDGASVIVVPENQPPTALAPLRNTGNYSASQQAFSGQQLNFTEEVFDLTQWAGQNVRLVFQVANVGDVEADRQRLFQDVGCQPVCGWDLSNIRIEGPAHLENLRLDRVLYPLSDPTGGSNLVARPGDRPLEVLLLNRGATTTEQVDVRSTVTWDDDGTPGSAECTVRVEDLRPGDAMTVEFSQEAGSEDCSQIHVEDGQDYAVAFEILMPGSQDAYEDDYDTDNRMDIEFTGDGPDIRLTGLGRNAEVLHPDGLASITVGVVNNAITDGAAELRLRIDHRSAGADVFEENVQHDSNLIQFESGMNANEIIQVPEGTQVNNTWAFRPQEVGCYRVHVDGFDPVTGDDWPTTNPDSAPFVLAIGVKERPQDPAPDCGSDYDLELVDATIDTGYDWANVGFGPDTQGTATLTIQNNGFFLVEEARVRMAIQDETGAIVEEWPVTLSSGLAPEDDPVQVEIPFTFPSQDGVYGFLFQADLLGDLVPGVPLKDATPGNDCRHLTAAGGSAALPGRVGDDPCPAAPAVVDVTSKPDLDLDVTVTPEAGRTGEGFPRDLQIVVDNTGNVAVEGAHLTMLIQHAHKDPVPPELSRWIIPQSPEPGKSQSWESLELRNPLNPSLSKAVESQITLPRDGRYFITVFLHIDGVEAFEAGDNEDVFLQLRLDAFDTVYSDTFEPLGVDQDFPDLVTGEGMIPRDSAWRRALTDIPDGHGGTQEASVWRLGDADTGMYGNDVDAALELPPIDLSAARVTRLALSHNYDLEEGYDGARLEASLDGGESWLPLQPRQPYPGTVSADSPLNADRDPSITTPAFTGTSQTASESGWVTNEFDLSLLPGFKTPIQLMRFSQDGFEESPHMGNSIPVDRRGEDGRITVHPHWALPQRDCSGQHLEDCWFRENLKHHDPPPLCRQYPTLDLCASRSPDLDHPDHEFWWTGSMGSALRSQTNIIANSGEMNGGAVFGFEVPIDVDIQPGQAARLSFWYWKDTSGIMYASEDPLPSTVQDLGFVYGASTSGWQQGTLLIDQADQRAGQTVPVLFGFVDELGRGNDNVDHPNRGAAVAAAQLEILDGTAVVTTRTVLGGGTEPEGMETGFLASGSLNLNWLFRLAEISQGSFCDRHDSDSRLGGRTGLCERDGDGNIVKVHFGWQRVSAAEMDEIECEFYRSCEAWGVQEQLTRRNEIAPVWQFGTERDFGEQGRHLTYPKNAHERLVTPFFDLSGVAGEDASLTFWELYDLMDIKVPYDDFQAEIKSSGGATASQLWCGVGSPSHFAECHSGNDVDHRRIYVQVMEPTPDGGERLGPWQQLGYDHVFDMKTGPNDVATEGREACTDGDPAWCLTRVDLSSVIGQKVRVAFEITTTRLAPPPAVGSMGFTWLIDEVTVEAESMTGQPVQLRLRGATDGSINQGHWMVQNLQLVGILYEDNVAITPDEDLGDSSLAPGETLVLNGTIRNLAPVLQSNIHLDLSVVPLGGDEAPLPIVTFLRDAEGEPIDPEAGPVGPIALNSAGAKNLAGAQTDRIPYAIRATLPENAPTGTGYQFTLRMVDDSGSVVTDENLGDHERVFTVTVDSDPVPPDGTLRVDPPTVAVHESATFELALENSGPKSLVVDEGLGNSILVTATRLDGEAAVVTIRDDLQVRVPPGGAADVTWDWTPTEPGFYRITATVDATGVVDKHFYTHMQVGGKPLYYLEDFSSDPFAGGSWTLTSVDPCTPTNCWRQSTVFHDVGGGSLFVGNGPGFGHPTINTQARSPWLNLAHLGAQPVDGEHDILIGDSPFSPSLSLKYMPLLTGDRAVNVMADREDDVPGHRNLATRDTHTDRTGGQGLTGRDDVDWHVASYPLFHPSNSVLGTQLNLLGDHRVSFQLNANWPQDTTFGKGLAVDLITVSAYDVEVAPAQHDITLRPGSDKTFYFLITNTGAAADTYQVRLRDDANNLLLQPSLATVGIAEGSREITLPAGRSALASVDLSIPFERYEDDFFTGTDLVVEIVSTEDPNRVATGAINVERFIGDKLPDLVTDLARPSGETGPVGEAEQTNFVITVANEGSAASRETDLVLFACPKKYISKQDEEVKVESIGQCGDLGLAKNLGELRLPPLLPSQNMAEEQSDHVWATTVSWIPEVLKDRGDYWIVAVADPLGHVPQFSRGSSVDRLDLTVSPFEQPDLHVTHLTVTDANGDPVTSVFEGDLLTIEGTVRNDGDATAPNVRLRILNQFALRDERIGDLNPGGTHTLTAQWAAKPGNWVVRMEASTGVVETTKENNAKAWPLAIRTGALEATWEPDLLHLEPGNKTEGLLRIHNHRDHAVDLMVKTMAKDISVQGLFDVQVPRGASRQMPVVLIASPFAEEGPHEVRVDLVQRDTGTTLASTVLEVHVAAQRSLRMIAEPLYTPPGTAQLPLVFRNDGTAPESFTVRLDTPINWQTTVLPPAVRLDPGSQREVLVVFEIPAATPAGRYPVTVESGEIRHRLTVDVVERPVWRSTLTAVHDLRSSVEVLVRVENVGNVPAVPPFRLDGAGASYSMDPVPLRHEPGEAHSYRIKVRSEVSMMELPGRADPVPLRASAQPPPVEAVRMDLQSAGAITSGETADIRFTVRNTGSEVQQALPVRLWVDGKFAVEQRIDLAADETRDVDFKWKFRGQGPLVVTATVGSSDGSVARTAILDLAPQPRSAAIPDPSFGAVVFVLLLAAFTIRRRGA